jgi:peptide chain release factor 1
MRIDLQLVEQLIFDLEQKMEYGAILGDASVMKKLSKEHGYLLEVRDIAQKQKTFEKELEEVSQLLKTERDEDLLAIAIEEKSRLEPLLEKAKHKLHMLCIPPDPEDDRNTIMEIRAGAGGQEAALFVADCVRMYTMYANKMGWGCEVASSMPSDLGGLKECNLIFTGKGVWRALQHEAGTHRVQRVPDTESQGRIHTSTITVAVLQEIDDCIDSMVIPETDLRMETTRASGAGGQHVNKTDSAVRITHLPTGIAVFCQEERSQHKNKDRAMKLVRSKVVALEKQKQKSEIDQKRLDQVGTGDRSEKIRTYNYPQSRVTDHRVNITKYNLSQVMEGDVEDFSEALIQQAQMNKVTVLPWVIQEEDSCTR